MATKFEVDREKLEVRISRDFKASIDKVWKAYTEPEEIVKWWSDTKIDKLDFRVGGKWRFVGAAPNAFRGEFLVIDPPHKITRTFEYEPVPGHIMEESVILTPIDDNNTRMLTISKYKNIADLEGMVASGMEQGAVAGIERLAKVIES